ncbi:MAG: starch-binding protein [Paludibacteraceae bacterium]|nr:starch-binding protein [Paludibacteraceae bacterium]
MKKILLALCMALPMLFIGCEQEPIVFEHEKPQFELKENAILLEVIVPAGTSAKDEIYIVGAFNGSDTIHYVNADYLLEKAEKVNSKYGIYLYPEDFADGKSLADGFLFVSKLQGVERAEQMHVIADAQVGARYDLSIAAWGGVADVPEVEHDGYAVFVQDETGWESLTLYMWGDVNDLNGGWPGMAVTGEQTINGITYKYFDMGEANTGLAENLIFNNNGGGTQLADFAYTIDRDLYLRLTSEGVEEISMEPEVEHDGYAVFIQDQTGWETITLYMWGDVNDLNGGWPGMAVTGEQTINGITYKYFDMGEANTGLAENLIFNNGGAGVQLADFAYTIDHDIYLILTPDGVTEEGTEEPTDPTDPTDPEDPQPAETVSCKVYVDNQTGWECFSVYSWGNDYEAFGGWPGKQSEVTEEIEGITYIVYEVSGPEGNDMNLIFNNKACAEGTDAATQYDAASVKIAKDAAYYFRAGSESATTVE